MIGGISRQWLKVELFHQIAAMSAASRANRARIDGRSQRRARPDGVRQGERAAASLEMASAVMPPALRASRPSIAASGASRASQL